MNERHTDDRRARLLSVLLLIAVFIAGGLTGAVTITSLYAENTTQITSISDEDPLAGLDLSDDQRSAIDGILAGYQPATDSLVRESIANLRSLMNDADTEVRAVLSPEQIEAYDRVLSQQPRIRAVRRVMGPEGTVVDTIR